jgi:hypothetical protein
MPDIDTFTVTLDILDRPEFGQTLIAPMVEDIQRNRALLAQQTELLADAIEDEAKRRRVAFVADLTTRIERDERRRENFLKQPGVRKVSFTLRSPSYLESIKAEKEATFTNPDTMEQSIDQTRIRMYYLENCVLEKEGVVLTDADRQRIKPNVGAILSNRLLFAAYPSDEELDFFE